MFESASGAQTRPIPAPVASEPLRWGRWLLPFVLVAIALRLVPSDSAARSAMRPAEPAQVASPAYSMANLIEQPGETFPGSAYFFVENAFAPVQQPATDVPPDPLPDSVRDNAHILAIDIGPSAAAYRFVGARPLDRQRALDCLTNAIYYEAANEPDEGQRAVAQVVLNRVRHPLWPNSVCGVVYQGTERTDLGCQFTFSCDGSMARLPMTGKWLRARRVALAALSGEVFAPAGLSTFYHTLAVRPPWSRTMRPAAIIGAHIFYRLPGADGGAPRFAARYAGVETISGPSANAFVRPLKAPPGFADVPLIAAPIGLPAAHMPAPAPSLTALAPPLAPPPPVLLPGVAPQARAYDGTPPPGSAPGLPQSRVKAEFRNAGRPLP